MGAALPRHILVVDRRRRAVPADPGIVADVVSTITEAVSAVRRAGYDAVLLRVDGPGEMSLLLRIKSSAPGTPLVATVPDAVPELALLASESGADKVVPVEGDLNRALAEVSGSLGTTGKLIRRSRAASEQGRALLDRMFDLLSKGRPIRAQDFELAEIPAAKFVPLLVENNADQSLLIKRCFRKVGLPVTLPVLRDGKAAIEYLGGQGAYSERTRFPLPSLLVVDLHLAKTSGFEVIAWVRAQATLHGLVVFVLTSSSRQEDFERALDLGADYYFTKPETLDGLLETVKVIAMRWGLIHQANQWKHR